MKYINTIDEQGRFLGYKLDPKNEGQVDSHTFSYLYVRKLMQECGDVMGLERLLEENNESQK